MEIKTSDIKKRLQDAIDIATAGFDPIENDDDLLDCALACIRDQEVVVPPGLVDALLSHNQCDQYGVMCEVSRQAVCEAAEILQSFEAIPDELEG